MRVWIPLMLLVVACQGPTSEGSSTGCVAPPREALDAESGFGLIPEDDTVVSGALVSLRFELPAESDAALMSISAAWQCWTEDGWRITHQLFHRAGDVPGERVGPGGSPLALGEGGATTTEEPIGLVVPSASEMRIPRVGAGTYRIVDEVIVGDGTMLTGIAIVDVIDTDDEE